MEDTGACSNQILFDELEHSREPPEIISARSLGQAADVLNTPRKMCLSSPPCSPEPQYRSARNSLANSIQEVDAMGSFNTPSPESTTAEHEHLTFEQEESSLCDPNIILETHTPSQRHDTERFVESWPRGTPPLDDKGSSPLRGRDEAQRHSSPPLEYASGAPGSPIPRRQGRPQGSQLQPPTAGRPKSSSRNGAERSPLGGQQLEEIHAVPLKRLHLDTNATQTTQEPEEHSQDVESQPRIPGQLPTDGDEFLPQWVKTTTSFLLSLAKRVLLESIPPFPTTLWDALKSTVFLLLSLAHVLFVIAIPKILTTIRDGLIRVYTWCTHRRPTTPARPNPEEAPTLGPQDWERTLAPPNVLSAPRRSQCDHCLSDYTPYSIIHCPSRHAVCLDCLSSHVAQQVPQLAQNHGGGEVVCLHSGGCGRAFEGDELQRLPEGVLRQLFDLVHTTSRSEVRRGEVGGGEMEVKAKVKVEEEEDHVEALLSVDSDLSDRLEDAISRCTVSLRKHRKAECEPAEGSSRYVYRDHVDSNSDVEDYSRSVSALKSLERAPGDDRSPLGSSPPMQQPLGRCPFATASPPDSLRRPETLHFQRAASAVRPSTDAAVEDPTLKHLEKNLGGLRKIQRNAQSRLRAAREAASHYPSAKTEAKWQLEIQKRREAGEKVMEADAEVKAYKRRLGLRS